MESKTGKERSKRIKEKFLRISAHGSLESCVDTVGSLKKAQKRAKRATLSNLCTQKRSSNIKKTQLKPKKMVMLEALARNTSASIKTR